MITGLNIYVKVGRMEFQRIPDFKVTSERHRPLTRISIAIPDPAGNVFRTVINRDTVSIVIGYRDQVPGLWEGTVQGKSIYQNKDQVVIRVAGKERPVTETVIKQAWLQETPEAIVRYAVEQAGLQIGKIEPAGVTFPRFVANAIPVWQVIRQCEHTLRKAYGLDMRSWAFWMGKDGKMNWHAGDEGSETLPVIDSNANLIRHSPGKGTSELGRIETFLLPHLMHSMQFQLNDFKRNISESYRAIKVEHVWEDSKARTYISYGDEYERY